MTKEEAKLYGKDIRDRRERSKLSVQSLALMVNTPVWLMKSVESGVIHPIKELKERITKALEKWERSIAQS